MDQRAITILFGDGIGKEIMFPTMRVMRCVAPNLTFDEFEYGKATNGKITDGIRASFKRNNNFGLKGPTETPEVGYRSPAFELRDDRKFSGNIRPVSTQPNVIGTYTGAPVKFAIVRECAEGEYDLHETLFPGDDEVLTTYRTTRAGCRRIAEMAFIYAEQHDIKKEVCLGHKRTIIKEAHRLWCEEFEAAAKRHPTIAFRKMLIDNLAFQIARNPGQFGVLQLTNLGGDILSDESAGLINGTLGFSGSLLDGADGAFGEALHGTAPDIVGKGIANPAAMILSGALLLERMGMVSAARRIETAVSKTLQEGYVTKDVNRDNGIGTNDWTDALISHL